MDIIFIHDCEDEVSRRVSFFKTQIPDLIIAHFKIQAKNAQISIGIRLLISFDISETSYVLGRNQLSFHNLIRKCIFLEIIDKNRVSILFEQTFFSTLASDVHV